MHLNFLDLAINGLQTWIHQIMESEREIINLITSIDIDNLANDDKIEGIKYQKILSDLKNDIKVVIEPISESVNKLKDYWLDQRKI